MTKQEAFRRCYSRLNIVVGAANSIAGGWLYDTVEELEKDEHKKLYRLQVKHWAKESKRRFNEYERLHLTDHGGLKAFYVDYLDCIDERVRPHTEKMYWAVKNRLDKDRVENSQLFAMIELTLTLLEYSIYLYRYLIKDVRESFGYDFGKYLKPACLTDTAKAWRELERLVCKLPKGKRIDLNDDEACMTGFHCIENILTNEDVLNDAAMEAIKLNPKVLEGVKNEE